MKQYLSLDLGGTFTKYALMDENGTFLKQGKVPSACDCMENMLDTIGKIGEMFAGQYEGVAVSMPGRIDTAHGIAHTGGNFSFVKNDPIGKLMEEQLHAPVTIANDGKCAASAEAWSGALADVEDGVVLVLGTGTGGGVVLNHQVRMGYTFGAGELSMFGADLGCLGSVKLTENGLDTSWMWAQFMSAGGLLRLYRAEKGLEGKHPEIDGLAFFAAYDAGEPEAIAAFEKFGRYAAAGIYSIQSVLDVQRYAIGGGISARPEVTQKIRQAVDNLFANIPFTPFGKPEIVQCKYGNDANLIGALSFHKKMSNLQ